MTQAGRRLSFVQVLDPFVGLVPRVGHVLAARQGQPHIRHLSMVERAVDDGLLPAPIRVQTGAAEWSGDGVTAERYVNREEVDEALRSAEVVICHGGAGTISSALMHGRTPIVAPRRAEVLRTELDAFAA